MIILFTSVLRPRLTSDYTKMVVPLWSIFSHLQFEQLRSDVCKNSIFLVLSTKYKTHYVM